MPELFGKCLASRSRFAVEAVKTEADRYAANVLPIIREAQKAGARTLREIAGVERQRDRHGKGRAVVRPERRNILERA
jgi:hypothetical protein